MAHNNESVAIQFPSRNFPRKAGELAAMDKRFPLVVFALLVLAGCAPSADRTADAACTVERLQRQPAPASAVGSLGMPPETLSQAEIEQMAACLAPQLERIVARVQDKAVRRTADWAAMSASFRGSEHGVFLQVYADAEAAASYRLYEKGPRIPVGGTILKRSFRVTADGIATPYVVFVMERMAPGFSPETNDWRFAFSGTDGALIGDTKGPDDAKAKFCATCHQSARQQDFLLFVPPRFRL